MSNREAAKKGHEKAVADQLLEAEKLNVTFERVGDADKKEPDAVYRTGGQTVGIEVATAYYDEADAQDEWEIATEETSALPWRDQAEFYRHNGKSRRNDPRDGSGGARRQMRQDIRRRCGNLAVHKHACAA